MFKSASNSSLQAIDVIYNSGLRLAIGAFRSSPIVSIYNKAGEYLPEIKRTDLALKYMARLARVNRSSLTKESTKIHQELKANDITTSQIITREPMIYPPWLAHYAINTELTSFLKSQTPPSIFRSHFLSILEQYKDYQKVYTDASKSHDEVGFSIIFQNRNILFKLPRTCSIFSAELADQQAKIATLNEEVPIFPTLTYDDIKTLIDQMSNNKWLRIWKHQTTKLNTIKSSTNRWTNSSLKRKEEIVLNRMRIGHTRITHGYLMAKEEAPICDVCGVRLTVKHIISECLKYEQDRQRIGIDTLLDTALGPETEDNIKMLDFLKSTNLFNSI
ncbi:hypothetical protein QTP88_022479 [Uroleucon formosanum]